MLCLMVVSVFYRTKPAKHELYCFFEYLVGFEWDDLDLKGQINDTANDADDIDYQCLQFSPFPKDSNFNAGDYNENEYVLLTQDKLNTTFQNHCYKLCYADSTMGSQETTNFTQKLAQNQMEDLDNAQEKAEQSILAVKVNSCFNLLN